jgi:hypothetical protein
MLHAIVSHGIVTLLAFAIGATLGRIWEQKAIRETLYLYGRLETDAKIVLDMISKRVHNL